MLSRRVIQCLPFLPFKQVQEFSFLNWVLKLLLTWFLQSFSKEAAILSSFFAHPGRNSISGTTIATRNVWEENKTQLQQNTTKYNKIQQKNATKSGQRKISTDRHSTEIRWSQFRKCWRMSLNGHWWVGTRTVPKILTIELEITRKIKESNEKVLVSQCILDSKRDLLTNENGNSEGESNTFRMTIGSWLPIYLQFSANGINTCQWMIQSFPVVSTKSSQVFPHNENNALQLHQSPAIHHHQQISELQMDFWCKCSQSFQVQRILLGPT